MARQVTLNSSCHKSLTDGQLSPPVIGDFCGCPPTLQFEDTTEDDNRSNGKFLSVVGIVALAHRHFLASVD